MQDYREVIKEHFSSNKLITSLLMYDGVLLGLGLLCLLFSELSIINLSSDILRALGFWCFWIGLAVTYIKKNDVNFSVGLGLYALLYAIDFIVAGVHSTESHSGFYGFMPMFNVIVAAYILIVSDGLKHIQKVFDSQNVSQPAAFGGITPKATSNGLYTCSGCGNIVDRNASFCPTCGTKAPEAITCQQCASPLEDDSRFCGVCGALVQASQNEPGTTATTVKTENVIDI